MSGVFPPIGDGFSRPGLLMNTNALSHDRLVFLDGVRATAALWVMIGHAWQIRFGHSLPAGLSGLLIYPLITNHLAVDVFIVLSGFCLILPINRTGQLSGGTWDFIKRRGRRILPPFIISMVVAMALSQSMTQRLVLPDPEIILANILLLQDIFPGHNTINPPFWSVALEWKIYFLFPLIVYLMYKFNRNIALILCISIGLAITLCVMLLWPDRDFSHTCPWYLGLFGMGISAGAAFASSKEDTALLGRVTSILTVGLLLIFIIFPLAIFGETPETKYTLVLIDTIVGTITALGLLILGRSIDASKTSLGRTLFCSRGLVWIGGFSYSLYLLHLPLLLLTNRLVNRLMPVSGHGIQKVLLLMGLGSCVVTAGSYLFHRVVERPFMSKRGVKTERHAETAAAINPAP